MNQRDKILYQLERLMKSFGSLRKGYEMDISGLSNDMQDIVKSGIIQKFEITTELGWKTTKLFIEIRSGIAVASPKSAYKQLYIEQWIDEPLYLGLLEIIDDRNVMSHMYREDKFEETLLKMKDHIRHFEKLIFMIQKNLNG